MTLAGGGPPGEGSSNPVKIFCNIFISFIGAGVLGLPYAFKKAGVFEGCAVMLIVSFFSVKAMLLLVECKYTILKRYGTGTTADRSPLMTQTQQPVAHNLQQLQPAVHNTHHHNRKASLDDDDEIDNFPKSNTVIGNLKNLPRMRERRERLVPRDDLTYGDVGLFALGLRGKVLVEVALIISQIGFCCAYLIFITENLNSYFTSVHKETWLLMVLPFLFLMTLYRQLHKLAFFSLFAQISNLFAFGVVFWFDFDHISHAKARIHPKSWSLEGFPFFFAVAIYCYEGAGMILSLEYSLAKPVRHQFKRYFLIVITIVTSLYLLFGLCGYLSFGPHTNAIITLNLPKGSGSVDAAMLVKLSLSLALFFTYPLMMFPVTELLQRLLFPPVTSLKPSGRRYFGENVLRLALVFGTGMIVICIPSFADLMALIGASCCTLLAFILPALFHAKLHAKTLTRSQRLLDGLLVVIGVAGAVLGTIDTLRHISSRPPEQTAVYSEEQDVLATATATSYSYTSTAWSSSAFLTAVLPADGNETSDSLVGSVLNDVLARM